MDHTTTLDSLYQAKAKRRKALIALPIDEKVKIIERLRRFGLSMRELKARNARGE